MYGLYSLLLPPLDDEAASFSSSSLWFASESARVSGAVTSVCSSVDTFVASGPPDALLPELARLRLPEAGWFADGRLVCCGLCLGADAALPPPPTAECWGRCGWSKLPAGCRLPPPPELTRYLNDLPCIGSSSESGSGDDGCVGFERRNLNPILLAPA